MCWCPGHRPQLLGTLTSCSPSLTDWASTQEHSWAWTESLSGWIWPHGASQDFLWRTLKVCLLWQTASLVSPFCTLQWCMTGTLVKSQLDRNCGSYCYSLSSFLQDAAHSMLQQKLILWFFTVAQSKQLVQDTRFLFPGSHFLKATA